MKSCVVCFTYPGDYKKSCRLLKNWQGKVNDIFFCIESKDANVPLPSWATPLVADFNRCKTLHGIQAIVGMMNVYEMLVKQGYDCIIKNDSDTIVFNHDVFLKPIELGTDFAFIKRIYGGGNDGNGGFKRQCNGCVYSMSKDAVNSLVNTDSDLFDQAMLRNDRHEDLFFSELLTTNPNLGVFDINKTKVWWSALPYRKSDIIAAHFGYCSIERIRDELRIIKPLTFDELYDDETEAYFKVLDDYCAANKIQLKVHKDLYDKDGTPLPIPVDNAFNLTENSSNNTTKNSEDDDDAFVLE